eukprot:7381339-Prymnesium_polylepis.1
MRDDAESVNSHDNAAMALSAPPEPGFTACGLPSLCADNGGDPATADPAPTVVVDPDLTVVDPVSNDNDLVFVRGIADDSGPDTQKTTGIHQPQASLLPSNLATGSEAQDLRASRPVQLALSNSPSTLSHDTALVSTSSGTRSSRRIQRSIAFYRRRKRRKQKESGCAVGREKLGGLCYHNTNT